MTTTTTMPSDADMARLLPTRGLGAVQRQYAVTGIEVRESAAGSFLKDFYGHASVTGRAYPMYGGPDKGGWDETITPGAFKKTLSESPDVAFLLNHEGMTLARTKSGTLTLAEDKVGLEVKASLDTRMSVVNDITVAMSRGDLDEMSFAFRVVKDEWRDADGEQVPWWDLAGIDRHINEISLAHGDVSVVNFGANPFTSASLRSLTEFVRGYTEPDADDVRAAIEHLRGLLPADETDADNAAAATAAYYTDLAALHTRRNAAA